MLGRTEIVAASAEARVPAVSREELEWSESREFLLYSGVPWSSSAAGNPIRRFGSTGGRLRWPGRFDQSLNGFEHVLHPAFLFALPPFELIQPVRQFLVSGQQLPQPGEGAHDRNIDFDGPVAGEHRRKLGNAVFGKGERRTGAQAPARRYHIL
jgi:hypothetical protein